MLLKKQCQKYVNKKKKKILVLTLHSCSMSICCRKCTTCLCNFDRIKRLSDNCVEKLIIIYGFKLKLEYIILIIYEEVFLSVRKKVHIKQFAPIFKELYRSPTDKSIR